MSIAFFVSPHGLGHAARAAAVMEAVRASRPGVRFDIFSTTPEWFFADVLSDGYGYHPCETDVGMVQQSPYREDLGRTADELNRFLPFSEKRLGALARALDRAGSRLVVCDISALGIAVARTAGLPSVLVENFTWDWIYGQYDRLMGPLREQIDYLTRLYGSVDHRLQTEPICHRLPADLTTGPVSRRARTGRRDIRRRLGVAESDPVVLVSSGGVTPAYAFGDTLNRIDGTHFVIAGVGDRETRNGNVVTLPKSTRIYHPDLAAAVDGVVGKAGYSTIAEVFHAGVPFGYVPRASFPEADALSTFIDRHMAGIRISEADFYSGAWAKELDRLLALPRRLPSSPNGADAIAAYILALL